MLAEEEARAALWRVQRVQRYAATIARLEALAGDDAAAQAVMDGWVPLLPGQAIPLIWER